VSVLITKIILYLLKVWFVGELFILRMGLRVHCLCYESIVY